MQSKGKRAKSVTRAGKTKPKASRAKRANASGSRTRGQGRLRPGQLDGLVLGYMKNHKGELPLTPTKVAHGIKRSSGAVGNCLGRLERKEKVQLTDKKPRRYGLAGKTK